MKSSVKEVQEEPSSKHFNEHCFICLTRLKKCVVRSISKFIFFTEYRNSCNGIFIKPIDFEQSV